jgi:hypothetical protein
MTAMPTPVTTRAHYHRPDAPLAVGHGGESAALFGPAYARLLVLMRQQASIHIDETSWRVDGVPHWLWVFVNDVVALYVVSRSRGSKVPQALLGPNFDGVVISDFFNAYSPLDCVLALIV